ncbi:MAG: DUF3536 domain-containing protein, partial [Chitinivibrionales bacterium]|nr:DUF3536 domain-containing protein [Chitinivibrionales bacterium]
ISGLESVQNLSYAVRALQLGIPDRQRAAAALEEFLERLAIAKSNLPRKTGRSIVEGEITRWLDHLPMLTFIGLCEKIISAGINSHFVYNGYAVTITDSAAIAEGAAIFNKFIVGIEKQATGERGVYGACIVQRKGIPQSGWIAAASDLGIGRADEIKPEAIRKNPRTVPFSMDDIFIDAREHLAALYLSELAQDTQTTYAAWLVKNSASLDALGNLRIPLPDFLSGPIRYVLTASWDQAMAHFDGDSGEEATYSALLSLWHKANKFGITIDYTKSRELLQTLLLNELGALSKQVSAARCDRVRYLLNANDRFGLGVPKNKIEDLFHTSLQDTIKKRYEAYRRNVAPATEEKQLVIQLISLARRMNFNTDEFPIG